MTPERRSHVAKFSGNAALVSAASVVTVLIQSCAVPAHGDAGATATDGYVTSYPSGVKLPKGAISTNTGFYTGSGTVLYAPLVVDTTGYRWCKLQLLSDNASGSAITYVAVGTNE